MPPMPPPSTAVRALAEYLCSNVAEKACRFAAGDKDAEAWAIARRACHIQGYATVDQAAAAIYETVLQQAHHGVDTPA